MLNNLPVSVGNIRDMGSIPGWGRFPGGGMATHSSILVWGIPIDRATWQAMVHRVAKSQTLLKRLSTQSDKNDSG